jgi:hypothetical protein
VSFSRYKGDQYAPHRAALEQWGVSLAEAQQRDYRFLTPTEMQREAGRASNAICMPSADINDRTLPHNRYRLLDEAVIAALGGRRYDQIFGSGVRMHFGRFPRKSPKRWARRRYKRVVLTEGEKKADEAARHGIYCVSIPGVSSYRGPDKKLHPELAAVLKDGLAVDFCYDTDQNAKPQVWREALGCADAIAEYAKEQGYKIRIRFIEIYAVPNESKTGLDDFIRHYGVDALKQAPRHRINSPYIQGWRERVGTTSDALPSVLRDLQPVPADWWDTELPPAENIVECYLQVMENAIVAGQGGTGKTFWLLFLQAAVASGTRFFGYGVPRKRRVLYLSLERNSDNFRRRWKKVTSAVAEGLAPGPRAKFIADIKTNCYVRCLAGESIPLIEFKDNQWVPTSLVNQLIAELREAQIEVMFLDPYSRLHGADENSSSVASAITKALERIAQEAGCSVVLCHHTGKSVAQGQNAPRGSSALVDNTSQCIVITKIEYDEAVKTLNLDALTDDERRAKRDIVCVDHVRASDGPTAQRMHFVRQPTGLLRQIKVDRITLDTRISGIIGSDCTVCSWADGQPFTRTQFRAQRLEIFGNEISEREAEKAFDALVADGDLIPYTKGGEHIKRKGGLLYTIRPELLEQIEPGSKAGVGRSTAPLNGSRRRERARKH